ncbi:hypothetical protein INR49_000047, partial [Caranx melampygus]
MLKSVRRMTECVREEDSASGHDSPETIELEINTGSSEGLILWQGVETNGARNLRKHRLPPPPLTKHIYFQELGHHGRGQDFISLGLQNGHLVFSYQLGSGEAQILSRQAINDGKWHKITAVRSGRDGYIQVDGGAALHGQSKGKSSMVNTKGSIYLDVVLCVKKQTNNKKKRNCQSEQSQTLCAAFLFLWLLCIASPPPPLCFSSSSMFEYAPLPCLTHPHLPAIQLPSVLSEITQNESMTQIQMCNSCLQVTPRFSKITLSQGKSALVLQSLLRLFKLPWERINKIFSSTNQSSYEK